MATLGPLNPVLRQLMAVSAPRKSLWQSQKWGNFHSPMTLLRSGCCAWTSAVAMVLPGLPHAESSGSWRNSPATATGASRSGGMDVGAECQLERTHMSAQRDCEQRRAALWRWICRFDGSPGRHEEWWRDVWGGKGSESSGRAATALELLPAPGILRGDHTLLTVGLNSKSFEV